MQSSSIFDCTLIHLPVVHNVAGNITAINNGEGIIPFEVNRVYYLYDIPGGESRGAHAHKELKQLIVAASGSFDITIDDGKTKRTFNLSRPCLGLYLPSGLWREIDNFSSGAICLVLASENYQNEDYLRDYEAFKLYKHVRFVEYSKTFLDLSWSWLNDPEIKELTMTKDFTKEDQIRFFDSLTNKKDYLVKGICFDNKPIGACGLKNIDHGKAEYWGYIGEKKYWGKGIGQIVLDEMVRTARELLLVKLYLKVDRNNQRAIRSYKKFGFIEESDSELILMTYKL